MAGPETEAYPAPALRALEQFADLAVRQAAQTRAEVDDLNVYPVPDGDTGTNVYLTLESALAALRDSLGDPTGGPGGAGGTDDPVAAWDRALRAYARGALMGARGNSGVILSQLVGAATGRLRDATPDDRPATVCAEALDAAATAAYAAVGEPVEGTVLTVARAAADAALATAAEEAADLGAVLASGRRAAELALERTPEQLAVLARAGVVDAGGRALCVLLDALESVLTGRRAARPTELPHRVRREPSPVGEQGRAAGPAYEVMYLLRAEEAAVATLRETLLPLGDSLVVVGDEGLWSVHVHVDDIGAAVEAGVRAGTPSRIQVTALRADAGPATEVGRERACAPSGRAVVAVAAGPGLEALFAEAGAAVVLGRPGRRPSTGELLAAVRATGAAQVVLLPNDRDSVAVAEAAARAAAEHGVHVVVVPTRAQVQGIAALAVHDPGRAIDADVVQMTDAARGARHGAVTVAAKDAITTAGPCRRGDVLGVVQGDFAVVGTEPVEVAREVVARLLADGGEMVTVVSGEDGEDLARACAAEIERDHRGVDVVVHHGGQSRYPLLVGVE